MALTLDKKGSKMFFADALSRHHLKTPTTLKPQPQVKDISLNCAATTSVLPHNRW